MGNTLSDLEFAQAMETCAAEPVHIPGSVQPFACLVGVDANGGRITYASENCLEILGIAVDALLGADLEATFGHDLSHAINNAAARSTFAQVLTPVGRYAVLGRDMEVQAFGSGETHVIQLEPVQEGRLGGGEGLQTLSFLMNEIQACSDEETLFSLTTDLLRHVTSYDRVMLYRFDRDFNGEIVAETKRRTWETFLGLRFPHWDIPKQAREIMAKLPLRIIEDVDQTPVPLRAADGTLPPLDITFAECRGVSPVHMEYLRNMGVKSTFTLSIVIDGALWGMFSMHHGSPKVPAVAEREVLSAFLGVFSTKLSTLINQSQLELVRRTDSIKSTALEEIDGEDAMEGAVGRIGTLLQDVLNADGLALVMGSKTLSYGIVPNQAVLEHLLTLTNEDLGKPIFYENLSAEFPEYIGQLNGCAGVLASATSKGRALCIFRGETAQSITWAGNPEKEISEFEGRAQLAPRGSFSRYLEDIKGTSAPWTDDDIYFAERIWTLVNSAERQALRNTLNRQQLLMINELNHRVRNILALVRSVSRQARRDFGSLESYSASLENRISALAAAHDIASDSPVSAVGIKRLVLIETEPYQKEDRVTIAGVDAHLRADIAPIFSLVIHELATNAAKYGALSVDGGKVRVEVTELRSGVNVAWKESGGPPVSAPNDRGFGSSLIESAVPHEMNGQAELRFLPAGVEADFFLPADLLEGGAQAALLRKVPVKSLALASPEVPFDPSAFEGFVLVVEDNFIIGKDMKDQLEVAGLKDVELTSNVSDALELINTERPAFAILDVNLNSGMTSERIALRLKDDGVPFLFATGYGDKVELSPTLMRVPRLTKPVTSAHLLDLMMQVLKQHE